MLAASCPRCNGQCYVEDVATAQGAYVVIRCLQCGWEHGLNTPVRASKAAKRKAVTR